MFGFKKSEGFGKWVAGGLAAFNICFSSSPKHPGNILSGAGAGASSSVFVYSLD
jgi:solute carrier family 25 (mitochondrial adenine nucleotide translocator), member 4/5/6/31